MDTTAGRADAVTKMRVPFRSAASHILNSSAFGSLIKRAFTAFASNSGFVPGNRLRSWCNFINFLFFFQIWFLLKSLMTFLCVTFFPLQKCVTFITFFFRGFFKMHTYYNLGPFIRHTYNTLWSTILEFKIAQGWEWVPLKNKKRVSNGI